MVFRRRFFVCLPGVLLLALVVIGTAACHNHSGSGAVISRDAGQDGSDAGTCLDVDGTCTRNEDCCSNDCHDDHCH
jgi:hypothetical protein